MSEPSFTAEELPLELARQVENVCDRFEVAWRSGTPPRLEDYAAQAPEAIRPSLLRELILLEVHYRQARGERCQPADYRERFPALPEQWLAGALAGMQRSTPETASVSAGGPEQTASVASTTVESLGNRIGPYKLMQKLGEGGMGTVYMAEQEQPVKRRVALKIVKAGMDSAHVIARFEQERQALAMMDHPNIARVFDAGTADSGRLYFVMELVKGIPITTFCDQEHLTPKERLELFIPVCQAVQHAHQKGLIHRDLKPSNVLIALYDGKAVPKVIDFGVAKATGQKLTERTMFTEMGQMVGTLEYMAPEQAELNNLDIDTRADIYALGVILYELLTGGPPFTGKQLRSLAFAEMLRHIREVEPQKPSTKLSSSEQLPAIAAQRKLEPAKLTKLVHGELDWIVMKALEKDRSRRYDTANGLAMEILRYLHDEPVLAGPPGAGYRLRKFMRRNRRAVLVAGVLLLALLAGFAGITWGMMEARHQRDEANQARAEESVQRQAAIEQASRAKKAEEKSREEERKAKESAAEAKAVLEFFQGQVLSAARPVGQEGGLGWDVTIRKALDTAEPKIEAAFRDQPLVEASVREALGATYLLLGEAAKACRQLERGRELFQANLGAEHAYTLASITNLATAYQDAGKFEQAIPLLIQTLAVQKAKLGPEDPATLASTNSLAHAYWELGKLDLATPLFEQILADRRTRLGSEHRETLESMNNLASAYFVAGKLGAAIPLFEQALEAQKHNLGDEHPETLRSMGNLAAAYHAVGKLERAIPLLERTLAAQKAELGPDHPTTLLSMTNLAGILWTAGKFDRSIPLLEDALATQKAKLAPDHPSLLNTMANLGVNYRDAGRLGEGTALLEESLHLVRKRPSPMPLTHALIPTMLAQTHDRAGAFARAEPLYRESLAQLGQCVGAEHSQSANCLALLGENLIRQQKFAEAEPLLRDCLAIYERKFPDDWARFNAQSLLGGCLLEKNKYHEAEPLLLQGHEGMKLREAKIQWSRKASLTDALKRLAQLYDAWGKKEKAAEWRKKLEATSTPATGKKDK